VPFWRFQASARSSHRTAVQRIFQYLKHTLKFGIWYSVSSSLDLVGFSDTGFAGCGIDWNNTSGTCHFLEFSLICWSSQKQSSVAQSTTEAEYVAIAPKANGLCTPWETLEWFLREFALCVITPMPSLYPKI
jgi:hypothetical protein